MTEYQICQSYQILIDENWSDVYWLLDFYEHEVLTIKCFKLDSCVIDNLQDVLSRALE